jgi:CheY-like chemotaxis protein
MPGHPGDERHIIRGLKDRLAHPDDLVRRHAVADLARLAGPVPTRPCRVLLVDDCEQGRRALRLLLEGWGHEVREADDGLCGVRLALSWRPDVALVDIDMPLIDGYGLARRVRQALGDGVRLVALTGRDERALALAAGFDEHLLKPAEPEVIRWAVGGAA